MERAKFVLPYALTQEAGGVSTSGWGPPETPAILDFCLGEMAAYPFEPSIKSERLGKVCDFTFSTMQRHQRDGRVVQLEEDAEFQLVDSRPVKVNKFQGRFGRRQQPPRRDLLQQQTRGPHQQLLPQQLMRGQGTQAAAQAARLAQQQQQLRQQQWQRTNRQRLLAEWSVEPQNDWVMVDVRPLSQLGNLSLDSSQVRYDDFDWKGRLLWYDKGFDKVLPNGAVPLSDVFTKTMQFYWPGTADDAIIVNQFDADPSIAVAATDQILSCLMAAPQSRQSWHLIFHKARGRLFVDKDNGSSVDMLTVNETHREPPLADCPVKMNRPGELAAEALKINQNFIQQVLNRSKPAAKRFPDPPFVGAGETPCAVLYRYRVIQLPGQPHAPTEFQRSPVKIVARAEIHGALGDDAEGFVNVHALNECPSRATKPWRVQLELQKGALLAQEAKNNHCKLGRWVCQAIVGSVSNVKIGFVARNSAENNERHSILNVQSFKVKDLGSQIGLREDCAWGIVRAIIDLLMSQPDGRYVLVKDPVKLEIKLYNVHQAEEEEATAAETETIPDDDGHHTGARRGIPEPAKEG